MRLITMGDNGWMVLSWYLVGWLLALHALQYINTCGTNSCRQKRAEQFRTFISQNKMARTTC